MADNYLERRMEALRSGQLSVKNGIPGIRPRGLRVVVAGGTAGAALKEVLEFRKKGYRVAIFDADERKGKRMAYENGVRFHRMDLKDTDAIEREISGLLKAWRNIDLIVGDENTCRLISQLVGKWRKSLPIPDLSPAECVILEQCHKK